MTKQEFKTMTLLDIQTWMKTVEHLGNKKITWFRIARVVLKANRRFFRF